MELYGLVSIIDEHHFGDAKSYRTQYSRLADDGRFEDLKARLTPVCHRTLRRQVVEYVSYTNRVPITQEFWPSEEEQKLYDLVSDYLQRPELKALAQQPARAHDPCDAQAPRLLDVRDRRRARLARPETANASCATTSAPGKAERAQLDEVFEGDFETLPELEEEWERRGRSDRRDRRGTTSADRGAASRNRDRDRRANSLPRARCVDH